MPFNYACFISYRHGQGDLARRIVNDLYEAIWNGMETWFGGNAKDMVFLDEGGLEGGEFFNESLAQALCESVCMIVVFTPAYFDALQTYCAREYKPMERLEQERLRLLGSAADRRRGLIIPIIFRGEERFPQEIKELRQFHNFDSFLLSDVEMKKNPKYDRTIKAIAAYIYDRCQKFAGLPEGQDPFGKCENFSFPTHEEVMPWLKTVASSPMPFPGRKGP